MEDVNDAKTAALEAIDAANAALPSPTQSDAGKVPAVNAEGTGYELSGPYAPLSAAIRPTANGNPAVCEDSIAWGFQGLKVYGKSTQDGMPSPGSPVPIVSAGEGGNVGLTVTGQNLLDIIPFEASVGASQSGFANASGDLVQKIRSLPNGQYSINYTVIGSGTAGTAMGKIRFYNSNGGALGLETSTFDLTDDLKTNVSRISVYGYLNQTCTFKDFMVVVGPDPLPYESYTGQSLLLSTPSGLPGIPVSSGGNYTDAEGQQSACDVKDYGTGKYTQMVGHIESYNGENITTPYMSTTGQLSTGAEVYYVLDEPVVTDISADELTAYRTLHTYDGTTVVSTAEDVAGLEVKYLADGEKYVERIVSQKASEAAAAHTMALLADVIREGVNGV